MKRKAESGSESRKKGTESVKAKRALPEKKAKSLPEKKAKEPPIRDIPGIIVPTKLADYLEVMTIAAFQAGVSWAMIQNKWANFRKAFADFDPKIVAKFSEAEIIRLMDDPGIMRSEKKIRGTIDNARIILELDAKHNGFQNYLRSFDSYQKLSADIQKRFKYVGEMSVYYFLFRVNEKVPPFDPWIVTIEGEHPRMREMVEKAAASR
jgi:3-methyladenine DNA glycosylase Tag